MNQSFKETAGLLLSNYDTEKGHSMISGSSMLKFWLNVQN